MRVAAVVLMMSLAGVACSGESATDAATTFGGSSGNEASQVSQELSVGTRTTGSLDPLVDVRGLLLQEQDFPEDWEAWPTRASIQGVDRDRSSCPSLRAVDSFWNAMEYQSEFEGPESSGSRVQLAIGRVEDASTAADIVRMAYGAEVCLRDEFQAAASEEVADDSLLLWDMAEIDVHGADFAFANEVTGGRSGVWLGMAVDNVVVSIVAEGSTNTTYEEAVEVGRLATRKIWEEGSP